MKYILSRKEWEELCNKISHLGTLLDNIYVRSFQQVPTGDIKYDKDMELINQSSNDASKLIQDLMDLTS
jgi:hypothetical protein